MMTWNGWNWIGACSLLLFALGCEPAETGGQGTGLEATHDTAFRAIDSDGDNQISTKEWVESQGAEAGPEFGLLDTDGNTKISPEEYADRTLAGADEGGSSVTELCEAGIVGCEGDYLVTQCNSLGTDFEVLQSCSNGSVCSGGQCISKPSCTLNFCEDPAWCEDDYPACPYGIQVGDIMANALFIEPNSNQVFEIGEHYGETGLMALVSANGW
jgi:hypothetical protein